MSFNCRIKGVYLKINYNNLKVEIYASKRNIIEDLRSRDYLREIFEADGNSKNERGVSSGNPYRVY